MRVPPLDLSAQFETIKTDVHKNIEKVFNTHHYVLGPLVAELESAVADLCGVKHAIGVASGSDALLLSLMASGVKKGDLVVTTPFTFFATVSAITRLGAKPYFLDVDSRTLNISTESLHQLPDQGVTAILPVHIYGQLAAMEEICLWAELRDVAVIEDAAQAIGASRNGHMAGSWGTAGCFSFYPTKNLGGAGDGGMITTNSDEISDSVRCLRDHGAKQRYYHDEVGINSRLDALQAAVLVSKLPHLQRWNDERLQIASRYNEAFADLPIGLPYVDPANRHIYHQYVIRTERRDELKAFLDKEGIYTTIFYPVPLHTQKCFRFLGYHEGDFPEAERAAGEVLALPIYPELGEERFSMVVGSIREFFGA